MFLPLAERMVEKMVKEDKIEAEAEVSNLSPTLYLHVFDVVIILRTVALFHLENWVLTLAFCINVKLWNSLA